MKRVYFLILIAVLAAVPAYAGHGTIRETDEQIIIEYSGDEDDTKAAIRQREELAKEEQEQKRKQAEEAKIRAAADKEAAGTTKTIRETDKGVTVEYTGGEDAAKATLKHQEDLAKRELEQREEDKRRAAAEKEAARAARRATTRPERADE